MWVFFFLGRYGILQNSWLFFNFLKTLPTRLGFHRFVRKSQAVVFKLFVCKFFFCIRLITLCYWDNQVQNTTMWYENSIRMGNRYSYTAIEPFFYLAVDKRFFEKLTSYQNKSYIWRIGVNVFKWAPKLKIKLALFITFLSGCKLGILVAKKFLPYR